MARILLVDDDPFVRRVVCAFLQRAGHEVIEAGDGEEGLERFDETQPDVVITDILMPRMNGLEMMAEMRRRRAGVPLLAMSGGGRQGEESVLLLARDLGAREVFAKPLDMLALLSAVSAVAPTRG